MKKKVLSWILILCMVVTLMPMMGVKADAAISGNAVKTAALNRVGTTYTPRGLCLCLVGDIYEDAGVSSIGSGCCAYAFGNTYKKSTLQSGIPIGAWVYFSKTGLYPCGNHYAGHIGVYVGDGKIVHTWGGGTYSNGNTYSYVQKTTISEVVNSGYKYCGWGIPAGVSSSTSWTSSLKATNVASTGKPKLTWSKYSGANKYYVYRKSGANGTYKYLTSTKNRSYTDNSAVASYNYYYKVKAVKSNGKGLKTTEAVGKTCGLASPQITSTSNVPSTGAIIVKWKDVKNANQYHVYRRTGKSGNKELIAIYDVAMNTGKTYSCINSNNITPGKTYYYWIKAVNTNNASATSQYYYYDYRTCDLARPVVSVNAREDGKPVISWDSISGADKYQIYRAPKGGSYSKIAAVTGTSVTNTKNLTNGKVYYYKVRALDNSTTAATSAFSEPVSMKYINKIIGLVSESTYYSKYSDSNKYNAVPYYRYKTRSMQTMTSTKASLSGWNLVSSESSYKYGLWSTTKPTSSYESTSAYYYYTYVCNCKRLYWKSTKSDTCKNCKTKAKNLLRVYSQNDPSKNYKKDTDGSYFTPKVISKTTPGSFGDIYRMTYKGSSITKFTSASKKNTSFLWPSSAYRVTLYRTKTPVTLYTYERWSNWSDWSGWTSTYKDDSETSVKDTYNKYYITIK